MITVVGIGPGASREFLFESALKKIESATLIIGSERQLAIVPENKQAVCQHLPPKLLDLEIFLRAHHSEAVVVLASGDPLTYGIGNWLNQRFPHDEVTILPGISSIHYLFTQLRLSLEDCFITSSHGREPNFAWLFQLPKVAMLTDQQLGPYQLAQAALKSGKQPTFYIGEQLSYPDERIRCFSASEVPDEAYQMNVVVILNE